MQLNLVMIYLLKEINLWNLLFATFVKWNGMENNWTFLLFLNWNVEIEEKCMEKDFATTSLKVFW